MTKPAQAMPPEYKTGNTIQAYQTFYIKSKVARGFVKYTSRERPEFLNVIQ